MSGRPLLGGATRRMYEVPPRLVAAINDIGAAVAAEIADVHTAPADEVYHLSYAGRRLHAVALEQQIPVRALCGYERVPLPVELLAELPLCPRCGAIAEAHRKAHKELGGAS